MCTSLTTKQDNVKLLRWNSGLQQSQFTGKRQFRIQTEDTRPAKPALSPIAKVVAETDPMLKWLMSFLPTRGIGTLLKLIVFKRPNPMFWLLTSDFWYRGKACSHGNTLGASCQLPTAKTGDRVLSAPYILHISVVINKGFMIRKHVDITIIDVYWLWTVLGWKHWNYKLQVVNRLYARLAYAYWTDYSVLHTQIYRENKGYIHDQDSV